MPLREDLKRDQPEPIPARAGSAGRGWRVWAALITVYLLWGSTYLGIRVMVQHLPALEAGASRFLLAGLALLGYAAVRGDLSRLPARRQLFSASLVGVLLIAAGNGGVMLAETRLASGPTALIISVTPLFMALFSSLLYRDRQGRLVWTGLVIGLAGLVVLIGFSGSTSIGLPSALIALGAAAAWAAGSVYGSKVQGPPSAPLNAAVQMLAGAVVLGVAGVVTGEPWRTHLQSVGWAGYIAVAYLVVFGSLIGFSAYSWLLRSAPISLVSTYAYVNPVVAVLLGVAILGEPLTGRELLGGGIILAAVALIVSKSRSGHGAETSPESHPAPPHVRVVTGELDSERADTC